MKVGPSYRRDKTAPCPACQKPCDAGATIGDELPPAPGDVAICLYCAAPAILTDDGGLRDCTLEELTRLERDPVYRAGREAVVAILLGRAP
jgi:hypothetical protein